VETSDYAAAGLVLLLTHNGELADLVLGAHAGVLTNSQPEALAAAIAPLATDPQQIARFRQASRKLAETFLDREKLAAKAVVWLESLAELDPVNPL
jgi:glycosyltransferase involved in cell wall biosynthesis